MRTGACALVLLTLGVNQAVAQQRLTLNVTTDPARAAFVYSDLVNFLSARDAMARGMDPGDALRELYFGRASPGLLMFMEKYDLAVDRLLTAMKDYPEAYKRIGENFEEPSVNGSRRTSWPTRRSRLRFQVPYSLLPTSSSQVIAGSGPDRSRAR